MSEWEYMPDHFEETHYFSSKKEKDEYLAKYRPDHVRHVPRTKYYILTYSRQFVLDLDLDLDRI
ncbi:hypothetical protein AGMMS49521_4450 [Campylobacterota bacterium]|nr:hypothetical protein AGMMS49521_4450 [Campylobacterota bacterium]